MRLVPTLICLAWRHVVPSILQKLGMQAGKQAVDAVGKWLENHFTDHSQRLAQTLSGVQQKTWDALEVALAGESIWASITTPADQRAFHGQLKAFLDIMRLPENAEGREQFIKGCLAELQRARREIEGGDWDRKDVVAATSSFARFGNHAQAFDAEIQLLMLLAGDLRTAGYRFLPDLLSARVPFVGDLDSERQPPLLVFTFNYFFRLAVEEDRSLFQGLAWGSLSRLEAQQEVILAKLNQLLQQTVDAPIQPNKYKARIERSNPTCLIFLVDQSESMENPFGNQPEKQKAQEVAAAINALLDNLVLKCKRQADIRDCNYCYIGLLGYSGKQVRPGLSGPLAGKVLVTPADLDEHCTRTEVQDVKEPDGKGGFLVKKKRRRIWLEPKAEYETPMRSAFNRTREIVSEFVKEYPNCFPPIVMNFTDGQPTENPTEAARELCQVRSEDGNVLLFNAHVSSTRLLPIRFPCGSENLPADDPYAFLMFHLSSVLPGTMIQLVQNMPNPPKAGAHGFVFNGDLQTVLQFLAIGTSNAFFAKV